MKIKTSLTHIKNGTEIIRGIPLGSLIQKQSFVATIFFLLFGRLPKKNEEVMFNAIFTSVIDHGPGTSSALSARISASAHNPVHASLAAGVLGFGHRHGMAVEGAMIFFYEKINEKNVPLMLKKLKQKKIKIPGFGHKIFTDSDSRSMMLFRVAKKQKIFGKYCRFAEVVGIELNRISSKSLPLNIDGAIAAILCDMGIDSRFGNSIFLIGRIPGLLAHIIEEQVNDQGIRRLEDAEIEYI